jgi:hypothetical protein
MTAEGVIELCRELGEAGIEHLIFNMPNVHEIEPLETFGEEIIPAVADLWRPGTVSSESRTRSCPGKRP